MFPTSQLPQEIQAFLTQNGFGPSSQITWLRANPELQDLPKDRQISFRVTQGALSRYVLVDGQGKLHLYQPSTASKTILNTEDSSHWTIQLSTPAENKKIATWAGQVEMGLAQSPPKLPKEILAFESKQTQKAARFIQQATNQAPSGPLKASSLAALTSLPTGHPAREFTHTLLQNFSSDVSHCEENRKNDSQTQCHGIYNVYYPALLGMKSAQVYYDAGKTIADRFPHLLNKEKFTVLYPAADCNVAALNVILALIENGAQNAELILTEINEQSPNDTLVILEQWASANPNLKIPQPLQWQAIPSLKSQQTTETSPQRLQLSVQYLNRTITLKYALRDVPPQNPGLYFHPADLRRSDIVIMHDTYADMDQTQTSFLKSLLDNIDPRFPKVILLENEAFDNPQFKNMREAGEYDAVVPLGIPIPGGYGHSGDYPISKQASLNIYWEMKELGQYAHAGALILSTQEPILRLAIENSGIHPLIDLFQLAGGSERVNYPRIPEGLRNIKFGLGNTILSLAEKATSDYQQKGQSLWPEQAISQWVAAQIHKLRSPAQRELLALITCRFLVATLKANPNRYGYEVLSEKAQELFPPNLDAVVRRALQKHKIPYPFSDVNSIWKFDFKKIDAALETYRR